VQSGEKWQISACLEQAREEGLAASTRDLPGKSRTLSERRGDRGRARAAGVRLAGGRDAAVGLRRAARWEQQAAAAGSQGPFAARRLQDLLDKGG